MSSSPVFRRAAAAAALAALLLTAGATAAGAQEMTVPQDRPDYDPKRQYVVTFDGDEADAQVGDGVCAIPKGGKCTLRAALQEANVDRARSEIRFWTAGLTIPVQTPLPPIRDLAGPTIIVGPSVAAPSVPSVALRGQGSTIDGLSITSHGNVVQGLALYGFRTALRITGWNNRIVGNVFGTNPESTFQSPAVRPDSFDEHSGVVIEGTASNNQIGEGYNGWGSNVIAGNAGHGILIHATASANRVSGNHIGIGSRGAGPRPNRGHGVVLGTSTRLNVVGGGLGDRNYIAANRGNGVVVGGTLNRVSGNVMGRRGTYFEEPLVQTLLPNGGADVVVGPSTEARIRENLLYGNAGGVSVAGGVWGPWIVKNMIGGAPGYLLGGAADEVIPRTGGVGVEIRDATHAVVAYNRIAHQHIGLRMWGKTPVLQEENVFFDNGRDLGW